MNFLVTGDAGKLGSRIKKLLGADGYDKARGQDILDLGRLKEAVKGHEAVVHCAGIPHPTGQPLPVFFETNVVGTLNVCRAAAEVGVKRVVYISSTAWYGGNDESGIVPAYLPVDEAHPSTPGGRRNSYGESKRLVENVLAWYGTNGVFEVAVLRSAPANPKAGQYPGPVDWRSCDDYRRWCLFTNCHPDHAASAAALLATAPLASGFEVFNAVDRYGPQGVNLAAFAAQTFDLPWSADESMISSAKLQALGWEPCLER